jgi:hypothetical protein
LALDSTLHRLILTLLESCAVLGCPEGINQFSELVQTFPHQRLLACFDEMRTSDNTALTVVCTMAACNQTDISTGFQYLLKWQRTGLIPPLIACHTLALEFFASCLDGSAQVPPSSNLKSLPFRGFMRFGALKYADLKLTYLFRLFAELALVKVTQPLVYAECTMSSLLPASIGEDSETLFLTANEDASSPDTLLAHYVGAYQSHRSLLLAELYLQHLYTKTLFVRSKQDKNSLISAVALSTAALSDEVFKSFFCDSIHSLSQLELSTKQQAKLVSLLLVSLPSPRSLMVGDIVEGLLVERTDIRPSIDVLKELFKQHSALSRQAKVCASELLLTYLRDRAESVIRIVQMLRPFDLFDALDPARLDAVVADCFLEDPNTHWMALTTYLGDQEDKQDACRRVCRLLLQRDSPALVLKVLTKFQFFSDSEFQHLLQPSESLFVQGPAPEAIHPFPLTLKLSQFSQQLIVVDSLATLSLAREVFLAMQSAGGGLMAIDSEWRPFSAAHAKNRCSLLQVATSTHVVLFDLMVMEPGWVLAAHLPHDSDTVAEIHRLYASLMGSLLADPQVTKIGRSP